jgi:hypothetical protein
LTTKEISIASFFSFTIVFSLEMVHKPKMFMYKSTLKMTDLQGSYPWARLGAALNNRKNG